MLTLVYEKPLYDQVGDDQVKYSRSDNTENAIIQDRQPPLERMPNPLRAEAAKTCATKTTARKNKLKQEKTFETRYISFSKHLLINAKKRPLGYTFPP